MPYSEVPSKFKAGKLHSGSKKGPVVKSRAQMVAIMLSEKRAAEGGKKEYQSRGAASRVKRYRQGGYSTDTQPAMLSPGEVVLNKEQQQKVGMDRIRNAVRGRTGQPIGGTMRYQFGGMVESVGAKVAKEMLFPEPPKPAPNIPQLGTKPVYPSGTPMTPTVIPPYNPSQSPAIQPWRNALPSQLNQINFSGSSKPFLLAGNDKTDLLKDVEDTFYGGGQSQPTPTPTPTGTPRVTQRMLNHWDNLYGWGVA